MKRKMALLEQAHGLLCNVPGDGGSAEDGEQWRKLRQEWIDRWYHLIKDQQTKEHNRHISIGNDAITEFEAKRQGDGSEQLDRIQLYRDTRDGLR